MGDLIFSAYCVDGQAMCQGQLQNAIVRALHALIHVLQEAASTAAAEAQSRLQAAEEVAQVADTAATEAANLAAAKAQEEYGNLRRVLDAVNAQKADLEGKLAKAGGALNAAEELKEARYAAYSLQRWQPSLSGQLRQVKLVWKHRGPAVFASVSPH